MRARLMAPCVKVTSPKGLESISLMFRIYVKVKGET